MKLECPIRLLSDRLRVVNAKSLRADLDPSDLVTQSEVNYEIEQIKAAIEILKQAERK